MVASINFESVREAGRGVPYYCVGYWGNPNGVRILTGVALFESSNGERFYCRAGTEVKVDEVSLQEDVDEGRFQWLDQPQPAYELFGRVFVCPVPDDLARSHGSAVAIRSQVRYLLPDAEAVLRTSIFAHDAERFGGSWPNDDDDVDTAQTKLREALVLLDELCSVRPDFFAMHALGAYVAMLIGDELRQQRHVAELRSQWELALRRCSRQLQWPEILEFENWQSQLRKLLHDAWVPTFSIGVQEDAQDDLLRIEFRERAADDVAVEPVAALPLRSGADALRWRKVVMGLNQGFFQAGYPLVHTMALLQCVVTGALASKDTLDANARLLLRDFLFVLPAKIKSYRLQIGSNEPQKIDYWESPKRAAIDAQLAAAPVIATLVAQLAGALTCNLDGSQSQQLLADVINRRVTRTKTDEGADNITRQRNAVTQIVGCALVEQLYRDDSQPDTLTKRITILDLERQEWDYLGFAAEVFDLCRREESLWHQISSKPDWIQQKPAEALSIGIAMKELGRDDFRKGRIDAAHDRFFSAWKIASVLVKELSDKGRLIGAPRQAVLDVAAFTACMAALSGVESGLASQSVSLYEQYARQATTLTDFQQQCHDIAQRIASGEPVSIVRQDEKIRQIVGLDRTVLDVEATGLSDIGRQVSTLYRKCVSATSDRLDVAVMERLRSVLAQVWQRAANAGGIVAMKCAVARLVLLQRLQTGIAASERLALLEEMRTAVDAIESIAEHGDHEDASGSGEQWSKTSKVGAEYLSKYWFSLRWSDPSMWVTKARAANQEHMKWASTDRIAQMREKLLAIYEAEPSTVTTTADNYYGWVRSAQLETGIFEAERRYFEGGDACWYRAAKISAEPLAKVVRQKAEFGFQTAVHLIHPPGVAAVHRYAQCLQLAGKFSEALEVLRKVPDCDLRTRVLEAQIVCSTFDKLQNKPERLGRALERIDEAIAEMLRGERFTTRTQMIRAFKAVGALEKHLRLSLNSFDWKWKKLAPAALRGGAWDGSGLWQLTNWGVRVPGLGEACNASLARVLDSRVSSPRSSYYLFSLASGGYLSTHATQQYFDDAVNVGLLSTEAATDATKRLRDKLIASLPHQDQTHVDSLLANVMSCDPKFEARPERTDGARDPEADSISLRGSAFLDRPSLISLMSLSIKPKQTGEIDNSDERVYRYSTDDVTPEHLRIFAPIVDLSGATWDKWLSAIRIENAFAPI